MRVKNVTIGIKSIEEVLNNAKNVMERLERGEKVKKRKAGIYFESLEVMRKAITHERLKILKAINPENAFSRGIVDRKVFCSNTLYMP